MRIVYAMPMNNKTHKEYMGVYLMIQIMHIIVIKFTNYNLEIWIVLAEKIESLCKSGVSDTAIPKH